MWYRCIFGRDDGGVDIISRTAIYPDAAAEKAGYEAWATEEFGADAAWTIVSIEDLAAHRQQNGGRYFRAAWYYVVGGEAHTGSLGLDITRARAILREHIREVRKPLLEALDVEFIRAQENGDSTTDIVSRKQVLRDLPQDAAIDSATTATELLATWTETLLSARSTAGRSHPR